MRWQPLPLLAAIAVGAGALGGDIKFHSGRINAVAQRDSPLPRLWQRVEVEQHGTWGGPSLGLGLRGGGEQVLEDEDEDDEKIVAEEMNKMKVSRGGQKGANVNIVFIGHVDSGESKSPWSKRSARRARLEASLGDCRAGTIYQQCIHVISH